MQGFRWEMLGTREKGSAIAQNLLVDWRSGWETRVQRCPQENFGLLVERQRACIVFIRRLRGQDGRAE